MNYSIIQKSQLDGSAHSIGSGQAGSPQEERIS